jgi:hypothetical protein
MPQSPSKNMPEQETNAAIAGALYSCDCQGIHWMAPK